VRLTFISLVVPSEVMRSKSVYQLFSNFRKTPRLSIQPLSFFFFLRSLKNLFSPLLSCDPEAELGQTGILLSQPNALPSHK